MLSVSIVLPLMGRYLDNSVGTDVIQRISLLPGILFICYGSLYAYRKKFLPKKMP